MKVQKNTNAIIFAIIGILAMTPLTSCKKYEDGPYVSLASKTSRVANSWKVEKATEGGKDKTADYKDVRITFTKEGAYTIVSGNGFFGSASSGTWTFINEKEDIQTTSDPAFGVSVVTKYHILKLTQNHLWVTSGDTEFHLISA